MPYDPPSPWPPLPAAEKPKKYWYSDDIYPDMDQPYFSCSKMLLNDIVREMAEDRGATIATAYLVDDMDGPTDKVCEINLATGEINGNNVAKQTKKVVSKKK